VKRIAKTLNQLPYEIIAIDDGSTDGTADILRKLGKDYPVVLLVHKQNKGYSAAVRTGLENAIKRATDESVIVTMDADMTHDPCYIPSMIKKISEYDIVIASRYVPGGKQLSVPNYRVILSKSISLLARIVFGIPAKDVTSSYRCFKASLLKKMSKKFGENFISSKGFECALEILIKAKNCGARMIEVPFVLDYSKKQGRSKMKVAQTIVDYIKMMRKIAPKVS